MTDCCTLIKDLGCSYSCDIIQIGVNAPATGNYTLELMPDGIKILQTTNTAASPLIFAGGYLNEDKTHVFKIIKPDGTYYETADGEDCFKITIKPSVDPTLANADVTPVICDDATAVVKNTSGTTLVTESIPSGQSEDITVGNSIVYESDGATIRATLPATTNLTLTGATVTDPADSSVNTLEDGDSYTCVKKLIVYVNFANGTDTITVNGIAGTISTESTDGASTFTYNGSTFAVWNKAWGGNVTIVRSSSVNAEILTLTGTYT